MRVIFLGFLFIATVSCFSSCQSAQKKQAEEDILPSDKERTVGEQLTKYLDQKFGHWDEPAIERTLNGLVSKLVEAIPDKPEVDNKQESKPEADKKDLSKEKDAALVQKK